MNWRRLEAPSVLLWVALLISAVLLLALQWNLTFFQDTWAFLLERQGHSLDDFLRPHNEHLVVLPVVVTKLCVGIFGMTDPRPETVAMTLTLLVSAALLFAYVRRRTSAWLALMAATLVLFLGSAWMILLWPFEIEFSGSMMAALGMLLALDREDSRGDVWACVLLVISIGFGSLGLPFAAAVLVDVFQHRRTRGLRRCYVFAVPLLLYLLWYLGWGHSAAHHLTLHNVLESPRYVLDGLASSVACLFGLSTATGAAVAQPEWGRPLLIALIALAVVGKRLRPGISRWFWPILAAMLSYWLLAAFNYFPGREAASNRYAYAGVIFVILIAAELLRGVPISRRALAIAGGITILALGPNLAQMKEGADVLKEQTLLTRADTGALEIARRTVPPGFQLTPENAGTLANVAIVPGPYFEAVDAHGSPAYSAAELSTAPPNGRHWADVLLSQTLPLSLSVRPTPSPLRPGGHCSRLRGEGSEPIEIPAKFGLTRIWNAPGEPFELRARRFASEEFPVDLGSIAGGSTALLRIPHDRAPSYPWHLQVEGGHPTLICN